MISAFGEQFVKTGIFTKDLGRDLNKAFGKRHIGDYDYYLSLTKEEAREILENAEKFIDKIKKYLGL